MMIKEPTKKQITVFVLGLDIICFLFFRKAIIQKHLLLASCLLLSALVLTLLFFSKRQIVVQFYKRWMQVVTPIGMIITGILMMIMFYLVFAPIGIFLKIIGKDILRLKFDKKANSYWIDKPQKEFKKEDYERQF